MSCEHHFPETSAGRDPCQHCGLGYDQWLAQWLNRILPPEPEPHALCQIRYQHALEELAIQIARASKSRAALEKREGEIAQIRASLSIVSVYDGIMDGSPTARLVSELARDHEELEARIDAVIMYLAQVQTETDAEVAMKRTVVRLLAGGDRVPDSPEGLEA
jgi:hypothetical protein